MTKKKNKKIAQKEPENTQPVEKKFERHPMMDSDEEIELSLTKAITAHKNKIKTFKTKEDVNSEYMNNIVINFLRNFQPELHLESRRVERHPLMDSDEETESSLSKAITAHKNKRKTSDAKENSNLETGNIQHSPARRGIVDSSEDFHKDLKIHKKNTKSDSNLQQQKERKNFEVLKSKTSNEVQNSLCPVGDSFDQAIQMRKKNIKNLSDYKKEGAVPKRLFRLDKNDKDEHKSVKKDSIFKMETENKDGVPPEKDFRRDIEPYTKPFLYVVPEKPSFKFVLPSGTYYIDPDVKNFSYPVDLILHPETGSRPEVIEFGAGIEKTNPRITNDLNISKSNFENHFHPNIVSSNDFEDLKFFDKNKSTVEKLAVNIANLKSALNAMYLEYNSVYFEKSYDKELPVDVEDFEGVDLLAKLKLLFPHRDENYLRKKMRDCQGRKDRVKIFVDEECRRLENLTDEHVSGWEIVVDEIPNQGLTESSDFYNVDGERTSQVAEEILKIQQRLMRELPELELRYAERTAERFAFDEDGLRDFISSEKLIKKKQGQFQLMLQSLPHYSEDFLWEMCDQFQGDEILVREFIEETLKEKKYAACASDLHLIFPDADPEFLKHQVERFEGAYAD